MPASPTSNPQDERRYWAFISYSHQDERWGKWLHHRLETFRLPKRLVDTEGRLTGARREADGTIRAGANPRGMQGYAVGR